MATPLILEQWLAVMSLFMIMPTLLMVARLYFDLRRFRKHGFLTSAVVSTACAIGGWLCFIIACGMALWRSQRRDQIMTQEAKDSPMEMYALGLPLREATIMHSYVVPTGLWLVKASFVSMYFGLKRHVSKGLRILLHCVLIYAIFSYLVLVLTHVLWCGSRQWAISAAHYCTPFAATGSISIYTAMNISSIAMVMGMPVLMIRHMQVRPREQWAIIFLLLLGGAMIVTTATCCGLHITYRRNLIVAYPVVQLAELLACIELAVAVAAVSLPSLRAVLYKRRESVKMKELTPVRRSTATGDDYDGDVPLSPVYSPEDRGAPAATGNQLVIIKSVSYEVASAQRV